MAHLISTGPFLLTPTQHSVDPSKRRGGSWSKQDLLKYAVFLHYFHSRRLLLRISNKWSFFRYLSIFLQTKNPNQCRILHLAMLQRHQSIEFIIHNFETKC
jgi:hypothetical protein